MVHRYFSKRHGHGYAHNDEHEELLHVPSEASLGLTDKSHFDGLPGIG